MLDTQEFAYLTVTGNYTVAQITEFFLPYKLGTYDAWDAGELAFGEYQYEQTCLRYDSHKNSSEQLEEHISSLLGHAKKLKKLPDDLVRTLHCVICGYHSQASGCYLDSDTVRDLAKIKAEVHFYLHKMIAQGNHDFPYSKRILSQSSDEIDRDVNFTNEYAYFRVFSDTLHADEISEILQLTPSESYSKGDLKRKGDDSANNKRDWTYWSLDSGIAKGQPLAIHLEALLSKLKPHTEQLYLLSRDYQTSFGLGSTAKFPTSNEIKLSREIIIKMAELNLSFDFDLYFHYDDE